MYWNGQPKNLSDAWLESQKQMWETWQNMGAANAASGVNSFYVNELTRQWRNMVQQGMDALTANADSTAKQAMTQLATSQQALMNFLEFSTKAWQDMATEATENDNWQELLAQYSQELRNQFTATAQQWNTTTQDSTTLWQNYQQQMQQNMQPWLSLWSQIGQGNFNWGSFGPGNNNPQGPFGAVGDVVSQTFNVYNQTFGQFVDSPPLGYSRELEEKLRKSFAVWVEFNEASAEYQFVLADGWVVAFQKLQEALVAYSQEGEVITNLQGIAEVWNRLADPAFSEIFYTD